MRLTTFLSKLLKRLQTAKKEFPDYGQEMLSDMILIVQENLPIIVDQENTDAIAKESYRLLIQKTDFRNTKEFVEQKVREYLGILNIPFDEYLLQNKSKKRAITDIRHCLFYMLYTYEKVRVGTICTWFGKDHSTTIYAISKVASWLDVGDIETVKTIELLKSI